MMIDTPIRIAVTGITGRMGKSVAQCIIQQQIQQSNKKIILGAALTRPNSYLCGVDVGEFINVDSIGVMITDNIKLVEKDFDILIDFTVPEVTIEYLKFCSIYRKNMVIGTTGFNKTQQRLIKDVSNQIGIVCSANFSVGIAVMLKLLKKTVQSVGNFVDIDIIETHHNKKRDIPSGTAVMMKSNIEKSLLKFGSLSKDSPNNGMSGVFNRSKSLESSLLRSTRNVEIHSIRSGDIIGEHLVVFSGIGERLEITHRAFNRTIFANGALYAAMWLGNSKVGLFDLSDIL